jgi:predicted Co/Zn/Cd cation transporter (cation efflux family)
MPFAANITFISIFFGFTLKSAFGSHALASSGATNHCLFFLGVFSLITITITLLSHVITRVIRHIL